MKTNLKKKFIPNHSKLALYIVLFLVGFLSIILSINILSINSCTVICANDLNKFNLQTSATWNSPITISGTSGWNNQKITGVVSSGDGSLDNPFIIENHEFDLQGTDGICLSIENSDDYFIIRNCVFKNIDAASSAGINMENVKNGEIIGNDCSYHAGTGIYIGDKCQFITISENIVNSNGRGIWIDNATDNIITRNIADNNFAYGIYITDSDNNMISSNTITNTQYGIQLFTLSEDHCDNNIIVDNVIINCTRSKGYSYGILIGLSIYPTHNLVYRNTVQQSYYGIYIGAPANDIIGNTISSNNEDGIIISFNSDNNKIIGNIIEYNNKSGIYIAGTESYPCDNNMIGQNVINYNGEYGILIDWSSDNIITGNSLTGNTGQIHENANCINQNYIYGNFFPAAGLNPGQILFIIGSIAGIAAVITIIIIVIKKRH